MTSKKKGAKSVEYYKKTLGRCGVILRNNNRLEKSKAPCGGAVVRTLRDAFLPPLEVKKTIKSLGEGCRDWGETTHGGRKAAANKKRRCLWGTCSTTHVADRSHPPPRKRSVTVSGRLPQGKGGVVHDQLRETSSSGCAGKNRHTDKSGGHRPGDTFLRQQPAIAQGRRMRRRIPSATLSHTPVST